jgi:hypothetical protein
MKSQVHSSDQSFRHADRAVLDVVEMVQEEEGAEVEGDVEGELVAVSDQLLVSILKMMLTMVIRRRWLLRSL